MGDFLKEKQRHKLVKKGWKPIINGAYLILYKDEFAEDVWNAHCETLNENPDKEELYVLIVGTK